jgi:diguanylate cyclase (GGDEF)-like protein
VNRGVARLAAATLAVASVLVAAVWIGVLHMIAIERADATRLAETNAANLARSFEENVRRTIDHIDTILLTLRNVYLDDDKDFGRQLENRYRAIFGDLILQVAIIGPDGILKFSNLSVNSDHIDLSDRQHFLVHTTTDRDDLYISQPIRGRVSNKTSLQFTRRINPGTAPLVGVIVVSVPPSLFTTFYQSIDIGRGGVISLVGLDGVIRARASMTGSAATAADGTDTTEATGPLLPANRPYLDRNRPAAGLYYGPSPIDGVMRLHAYRRLESYPLVVAVELSEHEIFDGIAPETALLIKGGALVTILIIMGCGIVLYYASRHIRTRNAMLEQEERIHHQAYHDSLTGLANRMLLTDRISQAIEAGARQQSYVGILFLDLDDFKVVNDSLGHETGDILLKAAADRLVASTRASDTVARLGGDEFVIVATQTGGTLNLIELSQRLVESLRQPFELDGRRIHVGSSIGVAVYPDDGLDAITLLKNADTAMYQAKKNGKDTFCFFSPTMNLEVVSRLTMVENIRQALAENQFVIHYQPKFCLRTGTLSGAEALVRWQSPSRGLVMPGEFIAIAEDSDLIVRIGDWVLNEVCRQLADWLRRDLAPTPVAVNASSKQFLCPDFADGVIRLLERYRLPPTLMGIEVTETAVIREPELAIRHLRRLREVGIEVSLDDFGTGYSSLSYLSRLPVDAIKIDRSFISDMTRATPNTAIVKAIISLGHTLGMAVIAEGVETPADLSFLKACGCPYVQGYLTGRPQTAGAFEAILERKDSRLLRIA